MSIATLVDRLKEESRIVSFNEIEVATSPFLKVYPNGHYISGELEWEVLKEPDNSENSLFLSGRLAQRILNFLNLKYGQKPRFARYVCEPDCHGAAMFTMGIVDYVKRLSPLSEFKTIYTNIPVNFIYKSQSTPVLVHLLSEKLGTEGIPEFAEWNTPHSIVQLGELEGVPVCFEKRGDNRSRFSTLKAVETAYGTKHRLYVTPLSNVNG